MGNKKILPPYARAVIEKTMAVFGRDSKKNPAETGENFHDDHYGYALGVEAAHTKSIPGFAKEVAT